MKFKEEVTLKLIRRLFDSRRVHLKFTQREPTDEDNPYEVIEHILMCRSIPREDLVQPWHDDWIDAVLTGVLYDDLFQRLHIETGNGGHHAKWRRAYADWELVEDIDDLKDKGVKPYSDKVKAGKPLGGFSRLDKTVTKDREHGSLSDRYGKARENIPMPRSTKRNKPK